MRNLKRVLSLALALVMMLGMMIVTSSAASTQDFADADEITNTEAVDVMVALGVIEGDGTNFNPTDILTREQAAKIVCYMLMGPSNAEKLSKNTSIFTDVAAGRWSAGYIAYCVNLGILAGNGDGTFDPEGQLTSVAFGKMLLTALGYDAEIEGYVNNSNWAINIATDMIDAEIDVDGIALDAPVSRDNACQMAFNTLKANMVEYSDKTEVNTGNTTVTVSGGRNEVTRGGTDYRGFSESTNDGYQQFCEKCFPKLTSTTGYDALKHPGTKWIYKNETVGLYLKKASGTMTVEKDNLDLADILVNDTDYFFLKDDEQIDLGNDTASVADWSGTLNGEAMASSDSVQTGDVVEIYKNQQGVVTQVVVSRYSLAVIDTVDTDVTTSDAKAGITAYVDLVDLAETSAVGDGTYNDDDIVGFDADAYVKGAKIAVALNSSEEIVDSYLLDSVTGQVTSWTDKSAGPNHLFSALVIDGGRYLVNPDVDDLIGGSYVFNANEYIAYLDANGFVLGIEGVADLKLSDLYYVYGTYYEVAANGSETYYALVVDMDGVVSEVKVEKYTYETIFDADASDPGDGPNEFDYTIAGIYTLSDKDTNSTNNTKANNGKYSATAVTDGTDGADYGELYLSSSVTLNDNLTSSSASIGAVSASEAGFTKAYLEDTTKFILVNETSTPSANISVDVFAKSTRVASTVTNIIVIASKVGTSYVAERVIVVDDDIATGVVNAANVLYLDGTSATAVKDGYQYTAYFMDGTNKKVTVDTNDGTEGEGFYNFEINSNGIYEIAPVANPVYGDATDDWAVDFVYDDETGYIPDTTIDSIYNGKITFTAFEDVDNGTDNSAYFDDITLADGLVILDTRSASAKAGDLYTNTINSLSKLQAAMNKGAVTVTAFVDNGKVVLLSVTDVEDVPSDDNSITVTSAAAATIAAASDETATAALSGTTITVTASGDDDLTDGDTIAITITPADGATAAGDGVVGNTVTVTYDEGNDEWTDTTFTVTAENGDVATYTVVVNYENTNP